MAISEIYVDPSIAGDSGTGTIGDPYGDLEYAIKQETFDTTNGTRVNVKAGTDEILAANLATAFADTSVSVAWAPTKTAPCIIQGYSTTAGDGGIGGISGGGSVAVFDGDTIDNLFFIDLHLHNCGAANVINMDNNGGVINCEVDNTTGNGIAVDQAAIVLRNYVHNIGGVGIDGAGSAIGTLVAYNYLANGTNDFTFAISMIGGTVLNNIINIDGSTTGILMGDYGHVINNSIYGAAGSGIAILTQTADVVSCYLNNLISDTSIGIHMNNTNAGVYLWGGNAFYSVPTETNTPGSVAPILLQANESLAADPFTDAANADFSPVDTGNVKEGSYPQTFKDS